jgi:glutaredoxin
MKSDDEKQRNSLTVTVYTSGGCAFCQQAVSLVNEAAKRLNEHYEGVQVVERELESTHRTPEIDDVTALPTIRIGSSVVVGLPSVEDLETLMYSSLFSGR